MAGEQTVCLLYTDLVDSTALATRVGPEADERLRQEHFSLLREAIHATGGREIKTLGDGMMVAFASSVAATRCAVAMQRALEQRNRRNPIKLAVRIGIAMGEATIEGSDFYGPPAIEGARLCAAASGGQILASEVVRLMAGTREDYSFRSAGERQLKGFPAPVPVAEVVFDSLPDEAGTVPLPAAIRAMPETGYVGREVERRELRQAWARVGEGERMTVLVAGEPGIGKTRLASHFAGNAYREGATVLYGRCEEDLGAPYQVWIEPLRHLVAHLPDEVVAGHVARHGAALTLLAPELAARVPAAPAPSATDSESDRYRLYAAIADLLVAAAREQPVILLLDDLHWADTESLSLLRHLSQTLSEAPLLAIGTYRDSEIGIEHPLSSVLAVLRREPSVIRLALHGLDATEVAELVATVAGHDLDSSGLQLAGELRRETNGNPFFTVEMLRHLAERNAVSQREDGRWVISERLSELGLPQSVHEVIGHRVQRLGGDALQTLSAAAVIGREFDLDLLARVVDRDPDDVLSLLEEGVAASILRESITVAGRFSFAHALIEHTLYHGLGRTRRGRLHERIATELEAMHGDALDARLEELAHHWGAAVQPAVIVKASHYAGLAGEQALASLAPAQARQWFERALELEQQSGQEDAERQLRLMVDLGQAQRQSGDPAFRQTLLEAARLAMARGDVDRLADAALAMSRGFTNSVGHTDQEVVDVFRATADTLAANDPRRAQVLALLALELAYTVTLEERRALADEALAIAREHGDERVLAHVLTCHPLATADASTRAARLRHTAEHVALCEQLEDPALRFHAYARRGMVLEAGDVATWDRCLHEMEAIVQAAPQPSFRWVLLFSRSPRALLAGEVERAEDLADEALSVGTASAEPDARAFYGAQIFGVRHEQGRLAELVEVLADMRAANPNIPSFGPMLGLALCEAGRGGEASELLEEVLGDGFASINRGSIWISTMGRWADVAAHVGHRAAAREIYDQLLPYADHFLFNLVGIWGACSHHLGVLARVAGRRADAERHLREAEAMHRRMDAPIWLGRTRLEIARLLLDADGQRHDAVTLLRAAESAGRRHGSVALTRQASALLARVPRSERSPAGDPAIRDR